MYIEEENFYVFMNLFGKFFLGFIVYCVLSFFLDKMICFRLFVGGNGYIKLRINKVLERLFVFY